jgi:cephalosporin-C deacetylase
MPLQFDLQFEQLESYQGVNPRPFDHEQFWDARIAEVRTIDPQIELVPSSFQPKFAECSHLYFTSVGGARVYAKLLKPRQTDSPGPAVLMFHGYTGDSGDWTDKLPYVAAGCTVAALDCRGQGGRSQDVGGTVGGTQRGHIIRGVDGPPEKMLFTQIFQDTALLARIIMEMEGVDPDRIGATGRSQGGGLTLACAALEPRIKLAAPVFPFLSDYKRVWEMDQSKDAYFELADYFRKFDPRHSREGAVFNALGYIDVQHLAHRIRAEVQMGIGLMDTVCPPSTQFAAYNKIESEKSLVVYPDFGHENLPGHSDVIFEFLTRL